MEAKLQKQIIDFFSFFEEFYDASNNSLKDCQTCVSVINRNIIRCIKIKEADISGTPLEEYKDLQSKLVSKLHNLISEEVKVIQAHLSALENFFEKLSNKYTTFKEICKEIDLSEQTLLVRGTPLQPPLKQLIQFAEHTITFGGHILAVFKTSLQALICQGAKKTLPLNNFQIPQNLQHCAKEIITYTSFCAQNTI